LEPAVLLVSLLELVPSEVVARLHLLQVLLRQYHKLVVQLRSPLDKVHMQRTGKVVTSVSMVGLELVLLVVRSQSPLVQAH
jgi:hypothetical protein